MRNRRISFEERTRQVMREENCDWWTACRILGRRGAKARRLKARKAPPIPQTKIDEARERLARMHLE